MLTKRSLMVELSVLLVVLLLSACVGVTTPAEAPAAEAPAAEAPAEQPAASAPEDTPTPDVTPSCQPIETPTPEPDPCPTGSAEKVAILVIDDFWQGGGINEVPEDPACLLEEIQPRTEELQGTNCILTPWGQAHFAGSGAAFFAKACGQGHFAGTGAEAILCSVQPHEQLQPHGERVYSYLTQLVGSNDSIIVVKVPTYGYNTYAVTDETQNAVEHYANFCNVKGIVLNMSFSIVPCSAMPMTLEQYESELDQSDEWKQFEDLLVQLAEELGRIEPKVPDEEVRALQELFYIAGWRPGALGLSKSYPSDPKSAQQAYFVNGQFQDGQSVDPLFEYLNDPAKQPGIPIISIGAAGNFAYPYPFAPAVWDTVLSVSVPETYSNAGEVQMPLTYTDYSGTSFAAPELSYRAALYLLNDGIVPCSGSEGKSTSPPLKYATHTSTYENLSLPTAVPLWCSDFRQQ